MKICTYPKLYSLYKDKEIKFLNSLYKEYHFRNKDASLYETKSAE